MSTGLIRSFKSLLLALPLLYVGCTFLAPYDEVTDQSVNALAIRTETALAQADAGQLSPAESQQFLLESIGAVRALKTRADLKAKNADEQGTLQELQEQYEALAVRGKPLRRSVATGLRATLLDLQQIQIAKKRSAASSTGRKTRASSTE